VQVDQWVRVAPLRQAVLQEMQQQILARQQPGHPGAVEGIGERLLLHRRLDQRPQQARVDRDLGLAFQALALDAHGRKQQVYVRNVGAFGHAGSCSSRLHPISDTLTKR